MNHLHIEEWIFSDEPLSKIEREELDEHLRTCQDCRELSAAWIQVSHRLQHVPFAEPKTGFTQRWQTRFAIYKHHQKRKQEFWLLLFYSIGAIALLALLVMASSPFIKSPIPYLFAFAIGLTNWVSVMLDSYVFFVTMVEAFNRIIPLSLWFGLCTALASLCVLWIIAFRRLTPSPRILV